MGKKSEERERRKACALEKFEASKATLISKITANHQPRLVVKPFVNDKPRLAPHLGRTIAQAERSPKAIKDGSRFGSLVTWCISKADRAEHWSWGEPRDWEDHEWTLTIHPAFKNFEQLTWGEIDKCSSGGNEGHKMHHSHEIDDLIDEAQERWRQLNFEQYDSIFRFRLGGQKCRAWGFIVQSHFYFVWWDRNHSIYPTSPQ